MTDGPITREEMKRWGHDYAALAANVNRLLAALTAAEGMREMLDEVKRQMAFPGLDPGFVATMVRMIDAALAAFDAQVAR